MPESVFLTPEQYLLVGIDRIGATGSRLTDFHVGSVTRNMLEGLSSILSLHSAVVDQARLDSYLATASGEALDAKAADYEVTRNPAVQASGTVRITRQASGTAQTIPAGWGPLNTEPIPGRPVVQVLTTADAVFGLADTFKDVPAVAVVGGVAGNVAAAVKLLPTNSIVGVADDGGYQTQTTFAGGVDAETDDELRTRVPLEVQGRVKGRRESFLAAALRVPGVESAAVLSAGDANTAGAVVPGGEVWVFYEGSVSLQTQVETECDAATQLPQELHVFQALPTNVTIALTVFVPAGTDTAALNPLIVQTIKDVNNGLAIGEKARVSATVQAIHDAHPEVVSITLPPANFRKTTGGTPGTSADVDPGTSNYIVVSPDPVVTINTL